MPRPADHPDWATAPSDPTDIVRPPAGRLADGWNPAERPPAQHFNWWQNLVGLWTRWLDERERDVARRIDADEWVYPSPKNRIAVFSPFSAYSARAQVSSNVAWYTPATGLPPNQGHALHSLENFARLFWPLSDLLPHGARITRLRALVQPGRARPVTSQRMSLSFFATTASLAGLSVTHRGLQRESRDQGTAAVQVIDTGVFPAFTLTKGGNHMVAQVVAGNDAGTRRDRVYALEVRYEDLGPRNY